MIFKKINQTNQKKTLYFQAQNMLKFFKHSNIQNYSAFIF